MFLRLFILQKQFQTNLSKQKSLDADPRAIQQIVFQGVAGGARLYTILEKSKETVLQFYEETAKVL